MTKKVPLSNRKHLEQKNISKSNSCLSESKNVMLNGADNIIPEIIKKTGRKVPLRHLDLISKNSNEKNQKENKHRANTSCLKQPNKSLDEQTYHCSNCPSFFTSRRGMANHYKLHGANKRYKCASCDFSCDNYKTLQIHKAFHAAASKEESESATSTRLALVIDSCANSENIKRETKEINEKTGVIVASNREFACTECPFISRDQNRLQKHLVGHRRTIGFKCSLCTYMSASAGFLKRHCQLHKPQIYKWPPVYIGKGSSRIATTATVPIKHEVKSPIELFVIDREPDIHLIRITVIECEEQLKIPENSTSSSLTTFISEKQPMVTDVPEKQLKIRRPGQKYLCGFCGRHFKNYSLRLLHCIIRHSEHIAKEKYKLLLWERLNICYSGAIDTTEEIVSNISARTVHYCSQCPFTCKQKSRLLRHENKHIVKAEHQCKYCTFSCRSTVVLLQHLRLHQRIPKLLQMPGRPKQRHASEKASTSSFKVEKCSECPYSSRHICDLRTHAQMHVGKREFACGQCTYSTKRSHVLDAHLQLHMAEKEDITTVQKSEGFKNHSILRRHGKIVGERSGHQLSSVYICRWCPYRTRICATLFIHHRNHFRNGRLRCEKCTFSTSIETKLRDHVKLHPSTESVSDVSSNKPTVCNKPVKLSNGEYSCQECPFTCDGYGKFWHHKQKHRKLSRYQCDLCSYSAGSNFCLLKHRQSHKNSDSRENCGTKMEEFM
ncbi:unnamed protein product [Onchocerca ochengi]|uniref:Zinc finger protein n=1 Tax=Onchocerca ochengi TaxID=42157 RepID=A0A182EEX3_ONCOC|nr:unnamed protein product [Onchocerca ochengi]